MKMLTLMKKNIKEEVKAKKKNQEKRKQIGEKNK